MRSNGIEEKYITGDATDREKFQKWAETLSKAIGNPLYHWSHLELKRYFGYEGYLNGETAEEVWNLCNAKLQEDGMTVRNLIKQSNVTLICTTDDPIDSLEWHKKIAEDDSFDVQVLPAWRPDKAMNIEKTDFIDYLAKLAETSGVKNNKFPESCRSTENPYGLFRRTRLQCIRSCIRVRDVHAPASADEIEAIFTRGIQQGSVTRAEELKFKTAFMTAVGKEYHKRNWVMQLHYGCKRDNNQFRLNSWVRIPDTTASITYAVLRDGRFLKCIKQHR